MEPPSGPEMRLLDERIDQALERKLGEPLKAHGGGGGMDAWQTSVENRLSSLDARLGRLDEKIDRNFIITWAGSIGAVVGLA